MNLSPATRRKILAILEPMHSHDAQEVVRLLSRGKVAKKLPERSRKEAREAKKAKHAEETAELRARAVERAGGGCEFTDSGGRRCAVVGAEMDHHLGGSGRRRQRQSIETVWMLCQVHHRARTMNFPNFNYWLEAIDRHRQVYGYRPPPHIERSR